MADHFVSLNRGEQGFRETDFSVNNATTAADTIELRITDNTMTRKDVLVALEAFERFFQGRNWQGATAPTQFLFLSPG